MYVSLCRRDGCGPAGICTPTLTLDEAESVLNRAHGQRISTNKYLQHDDHGEILLLYHEIEVAHCCQWATVDN